MSANLRSLVPVQTSLPIVLASLLVIACNPFSEEDVAIEVNDTVTLACTLSIPDGKAPVPTVILIAGSGPSTRDCNAFGFQLCRETAHHLFAQGIASLRCDKRGFGLSTWSPRPTEITTSDFAEDVLAQAEIAARIELWDRIYDAIERDEPIEELREELRRELLADAERESAAWRERIGDVEAHVDHIVKRNLDISMSKWGRFLLAYDPREDLLQMDSRVLALYGSKDVQVRAEVNARALGAAFQEAGKTNYEIRILENANHIFQEAVTGEVEEYSELPRQFIPGYLEAITAWALDEPPSSGAGLSGSS